MVLQAQNAILEKSKWNRSEIYQTIQRGIRRESPCCECQQDTLLESFWIFQHPARNVAL